MAWNSRTVRGGGFCARGAKALECSSNGLVHNLLVIEEEYVEKNASTEVEADLCGPTNTTRRRRGDMIATGVVEGAVVLLNGAPFVAPSEGSCQISSRSKRSIGGGAISDFIFAGPCVPVYW